MATLREAVDRKDWVRGDERAEVTLVEYGDLADRNTAALEPVLRRLQETMGDRLRIAYRHLPLGPREGLAAAQAAEFAGKRGKFWQMHDLLLGRQGALGEDDLVRYAQELGLDGAALRREMQSGELERAVREDMASAVRSGALGVPTLFINGDRYDGPRTEHDIKEAIERAARQPWGAEVETTGPQRAMPGAGRKE